MKAKVLRSKKGRASAQAVSRRLLTATARVRSQVRFMVDKVALGQVLSEYFGFLSFYQLIHSYILDTDGVFK
jgi:hypothetical protein